MLELTSAYLLADARVEELYEVGGLEAKLHADRGKHGAEVAGKGKRRENDY